MKQLKEAVMACKKCPLHETVTNKVIGRGSLHPRVLFIGEAPGENEDKEGKPFCGLSGRELDKWIRYLGLKKDEYAVTNVVKCRPPNNRDPTPEEIKACKPFLDKQIELLNPEFIVTLGRIAAQQFVDIKSITKETGFHGDKIFVMVHPAYVLRNRAFPVREVLSSLRNALGNETEQLQREPRILVFDLETNYDTNPNTAKIELAGFWSSKETPSKDVFTTPDISTIKSIISRHDILIGHNIKGFDCPILERYGVDLSNKILIDTLEIVDKRREYLNLSPLDSISLDNLGKKFNLSEKKGACDLSVLKNRHFVELEEPLQKEIRHYLYLDVLTTKALFEYLEKYFHGFTEFLPEKDIQNFSYLTMSIASLAYKIICHQCGLPEKYSNKSAVTIKGGFVKQPTTDSARGNIICLDVNSSYPHAMIQGNLFSVAPDDFRGPVFETNTMFPLLRNRYRADKQGEVEKFIQKLYNDRKELKKKGDHRQYLYKILLNSLYGVSGNPVFASLFNENTANDITYMGRVFVRVLAEELEKEGFKVLYQDTDSAYFVNDKGWSDRQILDFASQVSDKIKKYLPFPSPTFGYGIDYKIKYIQFFRDEAGNLLKKHYLFVTDDNKVVVKGLALKKRNSTKLSKKIFEVLKPQIVEKLDCKFPRKYIEDLIRQFISEDISIVAQRFVVKEATAYKNPTQLQAQIASRYGSGKHYLIKNRKIGAGKAVKYCTVEEAKQLRVEDLNLDTVWSELSHFIQGGEVQTNGLGDFLV